ncbi:MAG: hypothetical protein ABI165_16530 [Bryobacteraceae bacterium]
MAVAVAAILAVETCAPPLAAQPEMKLNLVIVEGDGAVNNIRQRVSREPIVQVEDENHKPIAGAAITFFLPDQGAGGVFANGSHSLTVMSDAQGRAVARGIRMNRMSGKYQIRVTANYKGQTATTTINQTSVAAAVAAAGISAKLLLILLAAGAGVATGAVLATRGGGGNTNTGAAASPTVITPGTPTVGGPR